MLHGSLVCPAACSRYLQPAPASNCRSDNPVMGLTLGSRSRGLDLNSPGRSLPAQSHRGPASPPHHRSFGPISREARFSNAFSIASSASSTASARVSATPVRVRVASRKTIHFQQHGFVVGTISNWMALCSMAVPQRVGTGISQIYLAIRLTH